MPNSIVDKSYALFPNPDNKKIFFALTQAGAKIIKFPAFESEIVLDTNSTEKLRNLKNFDWIIFPDVLTVDFFLQILETNEIDFFDLDETRVCALGEIVSDRLRFVQLHADVIPNTIEPENVLSALKNYIAPDEFVNLEFLLLKETSSQSLLTKELRDAGAKVSELPVYHINFSKADEIPKLKALLKGGAIDEFVFCAPTDFIALKYIFKNELLASIFSEMKVSAADNLIFQYLSEHNLKPSGLFQPDKIDKVER